MLHWLASCRGAPHRLHFFFIFLQIPPGHERVVASRRRMLPLSTRGIFAKDRLLRGFFPVAGDSEVEACGTQTHRDTAQQGDSPTQLQATGAPSRRLPSQQRTVACIGVEGLPASLILRRAQECQASVGSLLLRLQERGQVRIRHRLKGLRVGSNVRAKRV